MQLFDRWFRWDLAGALEHFEPNDIADIISD